MRAAAESTNKATVGKVVAQAGEVVERLRQRVPWQAAVESIAKCSGGNGGKSGGRGCRKGAIA